MARVCVAIAGYLREKKSDKLHLTLSLLQRETSAIESDHLLKALHYLTGAQVHLLDIRFEFIDEAGELYPLTLNDVALARKTQQLIRPDTGDVMDNYEDCVAVYYTPSEHAFELLGVN